MKTKIISIIIGALVVVGVGTVVYTQKQSTTLPAENNLSQTPVSEENQPVQTPGNNTTVEKNNQEVMMLPLEDGYEDEDNTSGTVTTPPSTPPSNPPTPSGITFAEVKAHNSRASCWSVVNGNVYDLTSWIPNHPGGEGRILSMCGVDGSSGYNSQHGGSGRPATILAGFKIGALAK